MAEQRVDAEQGNDLALEIAHLLFIDVVGYSKLLVNEQVDLMQNLNRIVRGTECFREAEAHEKLIRLPTGDGMVLLFYRNPEQPVQCALQIGEALRDHPEIHLRMGIHSGPVSQVADLNDQINIAGAGINIGQRVMDCGDAGHILLSQHVAEDLTQYRQWKPCLHDLGECETKHGVRLHVVNLHSDGLGNPAIPTKLRRANRWRDRSASVRPIRVIRWPKLAGLIALILFGIALATTVSILWWGRSISTTQQRSLAPEKSIAVLPFENRSEEKSNAYFVEGIQDEILTRLSKIGLLKVISRTSTEPYRNRAENLRQIARDLGVTYVVEGGVQKSGDAVRVNVQLINATTDVHVWADTFDRKLTDIFSVESDIARTIADQLSVELTGEEMQRIAARPTDNPAAYDEYLRGLAFTLNAGTTPASNLGAQRHLREAVRLDPKFALAWALLANVDAISLYTFNFQPTAELVEETRHAAETAFTLRPDLGEALLAKGYYNFACLKDYKAARGFFERAWQWLPNNSKVPWALALVTRRQGLWKESDSYFDNAERLDPRNPSLLTQHALSFVHLRHFPEALRKLDQVLEITPNDMDTIALKAAVAQAEGDMVQASSLLTPLRPTADHSGAVETQAYQALLERQPKRMIEVLQSMLLHPDPALGYITGELQFWLGWLQHAAGDQKEARKSWQTARDELESYLASQPNNLMLLSDLALTNASLGDKAEALAIAKRAADSRPLQSDAVSGPMPLEISGRVGALAGDADKAVPTLKQLLGLPYDSALGLSAPLTPALLRLDPMFDSLRGDPQFEKLAGVDPPR